MGIVNRTLDASEQRTELRASYGAVGISAIRDIGIVPYPATLAGVRVAAKGLSGSPTYNLRIERFITGTGNTVYTAGATTLTLTAVGTSGVQSMVLAASGNTLLDLQQNDVLSVISSAANTAVDQLSVSAVIQATQDIKTHHGI